MTHGHYAHPMSEHQNHEPPAPYRFAVGAGLGMIIGLAVGLFADQPIAGALIGLAVGIICAYGAKFIKP